MSAAPLRARGGHPQPANLNAAPFTLPMKCLICEHTWDAEFDLPSTGKEVSEALSKPCPNWNNCNNRDTSKIVIVDTNA